MASAHPLPPLASAPPPPNMPPRAPDLPAGTETAVEQALVPTLHLPEGAIIKLTAPVAKLPVELEVAIPVRDFRVRNLLTLEPGQVIEAQWAHGEDMPLASGTVQLAWSEFEVVDTHLAVRVTRMV
jgi:flagellar motor switch/type III secretory pathway protein FliN